MKQSTKQNTLKIVQLAIFVALIFVMQYIGTLASSPFKAIGIELSFVLVPIVIGAFLLGPLEGAILGFVFGLKAVADVLCIAPYILPCPVTAPGTEPPCREVQGLGFLGRSSQALWV